MIMTVLSTSLTLIAQSQVDTEFNITDEYTTFLGSNYSILIRGELTKEHVQEVQSLIGTIQGVRIGTAVTSIGNISDNTNMAPFYNQTSLATLTFKDSENSQCTTIGASAFEGCTNLTTVSLPNSIDVVFDNAFNDCPFNLVIFEGSGSIRIVIVSSTAFSEPNSLVDASTGGLITVAEDGNIYVPYGYTTFNTYSILIVGELTKEHVQEAEAIVGTITEVQIGSSVTSIGDASDTTATAPFYNQTSITTLSFKDIDNSQCTIIGKNSFDGCTGITSITFPKTINSISGIAFNNCPFDIVVFNGTGASRVVTIVSTAFTAPDSLVSASAGGSITVVSTGNTYISGSYTTFVGSDYSILIVGELTKTHVQEAEAVIGTIVEVQIGTSVTSIGNASDTTVTAPFYNQTNMTTLTFKDSANSQCTTIGTLCFGGCTGLTGVTLPNSLETVGIFAFNICTGLTSITLSNTLTSIGIGAFNGCTGLTTVSIPNTVTTMSSSAFFGCTGLTSITLSSGLTTISALTFSGCTGLTELTLPSSIDTINTGAFDSCPFVIVTFNGTGVSRVVTVVATAFTEPDTLVTASSGGSITVDAGGNVYTSNEYTTFLGSDYSILIVGELTKAHVLTAEGVIGTIRGVQVGKTVTSIGNASDTTGTAPFYNKVDILTFTFKDSANSQCTTFGKYCLGGCSGITTLTMPDIVDTVNDFSFIGCVGLTSTTLSTGLTSIGASAFSGCTSLPSITVPNTITTLASSTFIGCTSLSSVTLSNALTTISSSAFSGCTSLPSITLPDTIATIGASAFGSVTFTSVTFDGTGSTRNINIDVSSFTTPSSLIIAGPDSSFPLPAANVTFTNSDTVYKNTGTSVYSIGATSTISTVEVAAATVLVGTLDYVSMGSVVTTLGAGAFVGSSLTGLDFTRSTSLATIGSTAFQNIATLVGSIAIPSSVTTISGSAFLGTNITGLDLTGASSLSSIGSNAFKDIATLVGSLVIPSSLTTITGGAFQNTNITSINFTNASGLTTIGSNIFNTTAITSLDLSGCTSLTEISVNMFKSCASLVGTLVIPSTIVTIGSGGFQSTAFTGLDLSSATSLATIDNNGFASITTLIGSVVFPASLTTVGTNCFNNTNLTSVTFTTSVSSLTVSSGTPFGTSGTTKNLFPDHIITGIDTLGDLTSSTEAAFSTVRNSATIGFGTISLSIVYGSTGTYSTNLVGNWGPSQTSTAEATVTTVINFKIGQNVTKIDTNAFFNKTTLVGTVKIPSNITNLQNSCFRNTRVVVFDFTNATGLLKIIDNAFQSNTAVTTLTNFENCTSLIEIGGSAFLNCNALTGVITTPPSLTFIGVQCFVSCAITGLDLSGSTSLATIQQAAFNCSSLVGALVIPASVTEMRQSSFQNTNFTSVTFLISALTMTTTAGTMFNGGGDAALTPAPPIAGIATLGAITDLTIGDLNTARNAGTIVFS